MEARNIAIIGLGALGGPIAAYAKQAGHTVYGVTSRAETADRYRSQGLTVHNPGRDIAGLKLDGVYHTPEDLPGSLHLVVLGTKADALEETARQALPKLAPGGALLTIQNGYVLDRVLAIAPAAQVLGSSVVWSATLNDQDGSFTVTGKGNYALGTPPGGSPQALAMAKEILETGFPVHVSTDIRGSMWSKMCINCCITTLGAITGLTFGQQTDQKQVRRLYFRIISETVIAGHADQVNFQKLTAILSPLQLTELKGSWPAWLRHFIIRMMGRRHYWGKSSMLQSLERGRRTEVDTINGSVAASGRRTGTPTPLHDAMIQMVHEIEDGKRKISPDNLKELYALAGI